VAARGGGYATASSRMATPAEGTLYLAINVIVEKWDIFPFGVSRIFSEWVSHQPSTLTMASYSGSCALVPNTKDPISRRRSKTIARLPNTPLRGAR